MNRLLKHIVPALLLCAITAHVHGASTDLATTPLVSSANTAVSPNVFFVLDDSGSMDWDFLPDWACHSSSRRNSSCNNTGEDPSSTRLEVLFKNPTYNGVYYDPSTTYTPPTYYTAAGVVDTTTYPSQTGQSVATGGDGTATAGARNWKAVKDDAYGVQSASTTKSDLTSIAYHWDFIAGEYCATPALRNCNAQSAATGAYPNASLLRWCSSSANATAAAPAAGSCQAEFNSAAGFGFTYARATAPNQTTIVVSGFSAATTVSSITVTVSAVSKQILSASATGNNATAVAASIASNINKCTVAISGGCTISGFVAYSNAGTVTIGAPQTPGNITSTPVVTKTGMTVTANPFTAGNVPGTSLLTVITPDRNSYPFPGSATKASTRTDCAGATCTYIEEMTNFANWWTYYSSRMQMVKTAGSIAFFPVDQTYRVGYMSINNGTGSDFLNISEFVPAQKKSWYDKLFAANPGSTTPLRTALSKAGRLYAGKLNGTTLNGTAVVDPMEYSCQQNFTILSTDGYWNENSNPKQVNGSTDIGQQDGGEPKPFNDGATQTRHDTQTFEDQTQVSKSTTQIQKEIVQIQSSTNNLQKKTDQLQQRTGALQFQTKLQKTTAPLQWQTKQQQTTSTLTWTTKQQQATGALQWQTKQQQTNSTLTWATTQQKTSAPLQWQTKQQQTNSTLTWATTQQKTSAPLQWQTKQQQITSTLTWATKNEKTTAPLQWQTRWQQQLGWLQRNNGGGWTNRTAGQTCVTGGGTTCRLNGSNSTANTAVPLPAPTYLTTPAACVSSYVPGGSSTAIGGGNDILCSTAGSFNAFANIGANGTCTDSANVNCQGGAPTTTYLAFGAPACAINLNAGGTSTADASGNVVTACPTAGSFSGTTNLTAGQTCTGGANIQCGTTAPSAATYIATYPGTCTATFNGAAGTSTADGAGKVISSCPVNAAFGAATAIGANNSCNDTLANINCLTGANNAPVYVTFAAPNCTITPITGATSTADASGNVVTACPTGALSGTTNLAAGQTCTGGGTTTCGTTGSTTAYIATYPGTCTATFNGAAGTSTANGAGQVATCPVNAAFGPATAIGANNSCNDTLANINCLTGANNAPVYVTFAAPTCTITPITGATSTADASGNVVTACPTGALSGASSLAAGQTCTGGGTTTCGTTGSTTAYVSTYPGTCTVTFNGAAGTSTANGAGQVATCPVNAAFGPATAIGNNNTCNGTLANIQCSNAGVAAYTTFAAPGCINTFNGAAASSTANASGNVVTCSVNAAFNPTVTNLTAGQTCTGGGNIQCGTTGSTTAYIATYPGTCTVTFNGAAGTSTADGTGKVATCPVNAAFGAATAIGANNSCNDTLANINCLTGGATTAYLTSPTATCAITTITGVTSTADAGGNVVTACPVNAAFSAFANVPSGTCTTGTNINCQYNWGAFSNTASCTKNFSASSPFSILSGTDCQYSAGSFANAGTCAVVAASPGPNYTVANPVQCQFTGYSAFANAASCTPATPNTVGPNFTGPGVKCQTTDTGMVNSPSCTATNPSPNGSGQTITCQNLPLTIPTPVASCTAGTSGSGVITTCTTATVTPPTAVDPTTCTAVAASAGNGFVSTNCTPVTSNTTVHACLAATATAANNWTTTTCTGLAGGTSNTLADVAEYYYVTDLRTVALNNCTGTPVAPAVTGNTLCANPVAPATTDSYNNVPTTTLDGASWQHMTTFTLGLGASGFMQYSPSYPNDTSGDYFDVAQGTTADPANGICTWQSSGECTWPVPTNNSQTTIDDLWHAGVNGRGAYFSATSPASLSVSLSSALASVAARKGSSAAATTSNPNVTSGDNFVFSSTFVTSEWVGELVRQQLDLTTGVVSPIIDWAAQAKLDANVARNIYTFNAAGTNNLTAFTAANYGTNTNFLTPYISAAPNGLTQFCTGSPPCLSATDQASAKGDNLVNFLRGDDTHADTSTDSSKYYRFRTHDLGDIVNAEAVYVKGSLFSFADAGYSDFVTTNLTRQGMVYTGANDGMLHAFYAADGASFAGGDEAWAYIPSFVLPNLYKLADKNYANLHQYYVDGTPVTGDVCVSGCSAPGAVWKTILVGGLNEGGNGYYALDITDPTQPPKALWEFTDTNMGKTYGNPKIAKLKDGTWVVLVTSGYNNNVTGDGKGYLYVLNAASGALIRSIGTGVGSVASPSGLAKIAVRVPDTSTDSTAQAVYGGDLYGNLWRFDVNGDIGAAGYDAQLLAHLVGSDGKDQPITTKPELGIVSGNLVVFVGTGRYLGVSDLTNTDSQSFYAIKDPLTTGTTANVAIYDNPRNLGTQFVQQTATDATCPVNAPATLCTTGQVVRTSSSNVVNFATNNGWYIDLPDSAERANTDPTLQLGTLGFTTNVPTTSACTVGGFSFNWFLDYRTGAAVSTSTGNVVGVKLGNALATRPVYVRLPNNTVIELTRLSDGTTLTSNVPIGAGATATRRTSWRELITE